MWPKPLLEKHPQTLTLIGCLTIQIMFFFPGVFHTWHLTWFRWIVVSSEKITWSQLVAMWASAHFKQFIWWPSLSSGFDIGGLNFAPASFSRCHTVLSLISAPFLFIWFWMSRLVMNICWSARDRICSSCFGVVARGRPERLESYKSLDSFHQSSPYFTVFLSLLTSFTTAFHPSLGPKGWQDKKTIS